MKDPADRDTLRQKYEQKIPREGTCGPTLIAFLLEKSVKEIIDNWSIPYRGYCSFSELGREINKYGFVTERVKSEIKNECVLPDGVESAIARIQWKKKYVNFKIPEKNTHFVYLERIGDKIRLFDNEVGFFEADSKRAKRYLAHGKFTSLICLKE